MAYIAPLAGEFLLAGAIASVGYALGKRKRDPDSENLAMAVKALKTTAEVLENRAQAETSKMNILADRICGLEGQLSAAARDKDAYADKQQHMEDHLEGRMQQLERQVAVEAEEVRSKAEASRVEGLSGKVQDLEGQILEAGHSGRRVEQVAGRVQDLEDRVEAQAKSKKVKELTQRVNDLEGRVDAQSTASQVTDLFGQIRIVQEKVDAAFSGTEATGGRLEQLQERVQALTRGLANESACNQVQVEAWNARFQELSQKAEDLQSGAEADTSRVEGLEEEQGRLAKRVEVAEAQGLDGKTLAELNRCRVEQVAGRVQWLEGRLEESEGSAGDKFEKLAGRVESVESQELDSRTLTELNRSRIEVVAGRVKALEGKLEEGERSAESQLEKIVGRMEGLESKVEAEAAAAARNTTTELAKLEEAQEAIQERSNRAREQADANGAAIVANGAAIDQLQKRIQATQEELGAELNHCRVQSNSCNHLVEQLALEFEQMRQETAGNGGRLQELKDQVLEALTQQQRQAAAGDRRLTDAEREIGSLHRRVNEVEEEEMQRAAAAAAEREAQRQPPAPAAAAPADAGPSPTAAFCLLERLAAEVEELKRTRPMRQMRLRPKKGGKVRKLQKLRRAIKVQKKVRTRSLRRLRRRHDRTRELPQNDGLLLDLQAKVSHLSDAVDHVNSRIHLLEMVAQTAPICVKEERKEEPTSDNLVELSEEIW